MFNLKNMNMENLKINYVCLALSILGLLLVSCKDDEAYPYPAGKELLNYEMPMYIIAGDGPEPKPLPADCIIYYDYPEGVNSNILSNFWFEGRLYDTYGLSAKIKSWGITPPATVKVLVTGKFAAEECQTKPDTRSNQSCYDVLFTVHSITLK